MLKKLNIVFLIVALIFSLTACGFHLVGTEPLPQGLQVLALDSNTPYDPFMAELRSNLLSRHVKIVSSAQAPYTLHVQNISLTTEETSVAASQYTRQYQVTYSVMFSITDKKGKVIVSPFNISAGQPVTMFNNQLLTNTNQVQEIQQTLKRQVMMQLFDHLQAAAPELKN